MPTYDSTLTYDATSAYDSAGAVLGSGVVRGINVSGAEFAPQYTAAQNGLNGDGSRFSNLNVGILDDDYHFDSRSSATYTDFSSMQYLYNQGHRYLKVNLRWERMQPTLNAALDSTQVGLVNQVLTRATAIGMKIVLDIHNYGLYYLGSTGARKVIGVDSEVTVAYFADLWSRMTTAFGSNPAVYGFAIMNEPQNAGGMTKAIWQTASQAAVTAIRAVSATPVIHVSGWTWGDCFNWVGNNGSSGWITDSANNFRYEAHHYWSQGNDGNYTTYAAALAYATGTRGYTAGANPDALYTRLYDDLSLFQAWLTANSARGLIGEFSWPKLADTTGTAGDQAKWDALAEAYLTRLDSYGMDAFAWSCGEFYGNGTADPLVMYNLAGAGGTAPPNRLGVRNNQAYVLEQHLSTHSLSMRPIVLRGVNRGGVAQSLTVRSP